MYYKEKPAQYLQGCSQTHGKIRWDPLRAVVAAQDGSNSDFNLRHLLTLLLSPRMDSSSISSKFFVRVSRRQRPQKVPPPRLLPETRSLALSLSTFSMLTPEPMFTSRYGNRSLSAAQGHGLQGVGV